MKKNIIKLRKKRRTLRSIFKLLKGILYISILIILTSTLYKGIQRSSFKEKEVEKKKIQVEKLIKENRKYREEIKKLQNLEEVEKLAREMGLVKKNEVMFKLVVPQKGGKE